VREIKHITQPTQTTCVSSCVAMFLGKDIQEVIEEFHDKYFNYEIEINEYLLTKGVETAPYREDLKHPGYYFVAVSSLNIEGGLHEILVVVDETLSHAVYDPQKGNEGKLYYVARGPIGHFGQVLFDTKDIGNFRIDAWIPL